MKKLVAYFSATGITKKVAEKISKLEETDLYEITPEIPYTNEDLNWANKNSRSTIEMKDKTFRPQITGQLDNMDDYDVIYLGFPIWWYVAPTIINTFLENYNLENKTIILFATSGSSEFGETAKELQSSCSNNTKIIEGKVFRTSISEEEINNWLKSIKI